MDGGIDTGLDGALRQLAAFRRRCKADRRDGVVAQLVEHHNGIASLSSLPPQVVTPSVRSSQRESSRSFVPGLSSVNADGPLLPSLADAVADMLRSKAASRRRPSYVRSLRQYLGAFARGREHVPISALTSVDIEQWFADRAEAPATRAANIGRLSALFAYAIRRGWVAHNPCSRLERIRIEHRPPRILSVDESRRLLDVMPDAIRAWVVLGLFVGLRPSEAERLNWSAVRLVGVDPCVVVDAAASKVRRRRIVPLSETAVVWLATCRHREGAVVSSHSTMRRARRAAAKAAGLEWGQDILRHTYASMRLAVGHDVGRVAREMGNSPQILLTHYAELVTRGEADRFWNLRPASP